MPTDPVDNINLQYVSLPLDADRNKLPALIGAIVSSGDIVGYLPLKVIDNSDGTATLETTGGGGGGGIDPVGLKNILNATINPATEDTLALIEAITSQINFIGPSLDVKQSIVEALAEDPSSAVGTRLKTYEQTSSLIDSPITFNVKADMDTFYSQTDTQVRFLRVQTDKTITIVITSVDGASEAITVKSGEIFNLSTFDIISFVINVLSNNTELRILAEGF